MKKIGAILLVFCMMLSMTLVPVSAETVEPVVIDATADVKNYYDNGMNGGNGNLEIFKENLMLRPCGEWVTYDISNLVAGTYSVDVLYKLNGNVVWKSTGLDFAVDGNLESRAYISHTGGWDADAVTANTGKIYVPEGAQELKVKNHGIYSINLDTITLTYVGAEDTSEDILIYGQNVTSNPNSTKTSHEFYLGVDYWDAATGTDETFTKEDEDGNMHLPLTSSKTFEGTKLVQHVGDWTRYDISDFKAGTYEVTLNRAHKVDATYALKIDGKTALQTKMTKTADSYGTYADVVLGKIYVGENSEYLTLLNEGSGSVYVDNMKFKYISSERAEETIPSVSFYGTSVIPGGQGVGFWANSMASGSPTLETNNTQAVLRQGGEWLAYDVSELEVGTYTLNLSYTVREDIGFYLDIYVDDVLQSKIKPPKTTNTLGGAPDTIEACKIEITKDSKVLKIRNSSRCVTNICAIELDYVSASNDDAYVIRQYGDHATLCDANGVASYVSGVDFYDVSGKDITGRMENGIYISDKGDWVRYDIKGIKPGTYKVTYNHSNKAAAFLRFKVDGEMMLTKELSATAADYGTYADTGLGNVYIPEGAETFILQNDGDGTIYSKYIELEKISDKQTAKPSFSFRANGVIPGGQGVGYYDNVNITPSQNGALEVSGTTVTLRPQEWLRYDVSEFKAGTYSVSVNNKSTANVPFNVYVDDKLVLGVDTYATGSSWSDATYDDNYIGSVYIGEDTETITIKNAHSAATSYVAKILFDFETEEDESWLNIKLSSTDPYKIDGEIIAASSADDKEASFYDAGGESKLELENNAKVPILREGDWIKYDITELNLDAGIYTVYANININATTAIGVSAEGEAVHHIMTVEKSDDTTDVEIGKIVVDEDTTYFTVSGEHTQRVILYGLVLRSDAEESTSVVYTSDAEGKNVISTLADQESVYVTVDMIRPKEASIDETVYVALYDGGKLDYVQLDAVTDGYRFTKTYEVTGLGELSKIKTFVWETDGYVPVISVSDTTISAQ